MTSTIIVHQFLDIVLSIRLLVLVITKKNLKNKKFKSRKFVKVYFTGREKYRVGFSETNAGMTSLKHEKLFLLNNQ
jgi:hypothetical protein